jgi:hypothetical protein
MTITVDIRDRHGEPIELGQVVAVRVSRRSGSYGSWWRQSNVNHFTEYWIPGNFEYSKFNHALAIRVDRESEKALAAPMGREQIEQVVDYLNVDFLDRNNFDALDVPKPGTFRKIIGGER